MSVSIAILRVMVSHGLDLKAIELFAGHSLGEYSALCASGVISLRDTAVILRKRGNAMQKAVPEGKGSMVAVLGLNSENVRDLLITSKCDRRLVQVANDNDPSQVVISGESNSISEISQKLKEAGAKKILEINVGGAFHSPLMTSAKDKLKKKLNQTALNDSSIPVYSNFTSKAITNKDDILDSLINQIDNPVYWHQSITNIKSDGFDNFIEVGPGKVLQTLCKRIDSTLSISGVESNHQINELTNV